MVSPPIKLAAICVLAAIVAGCAACPMDDIDRAIARLHDPDPMVRREAARQLGRLGETRAVDPLIRVLYDKDPYVRAEAAEALGNLGDPRALETLKRAYKRNTIKSLDWYYEEALIKLRDKTE